MPTDVGNSFNGTFKFLRDRMWSKIKGWLEKILSAGGKEVLILPRVVLNGMLQTSAGFMQPHQLSNQTILVG